MLKFYIILSVFVGASLCNTLTSTACEGSTMTLSCPTGLISISTFLYGRLNGITTNCSITGVTSSCVSTTALAYAQNLCKGKATCTGLIQNEMLGGDPCPGLPKFAYAIYSCVGGSGGGTTPGNLPDTVTKTICEGDSISIGCTTETKLQITAASWGRSSATTCPTTTGTTNTNCAATDTLSRVQANCKNPLYCNVAATTADLGDPCNGTSKYLTLSYRCV